MKILNHIAGFANHLLRIVTGLLAAVMLIYGLYVLYDICYTGENAFVSEDLLQYRPKIVSKDEKPEGEASLDALTALNPDTVGWLEVFGTHINYPVVHGDNDLEYINKDIYGNSTVTGSIYLAADNAGSFGDWYNVIYGHHMDNGAMFGDIDKYLDPEYFKSHSKGILQTSEGSWEVTIFACVSKIEIYLPKDTYQALSVDASTGNVDISKDFTFDCISVSLDTGSIDCQASADGDVSMKTDTGHIVVSGVSASTMSLTSDTGRMDIANAEISGDMEIREDTGKVNMENVTCRNLTSDGDTGSLVMTKVLAAGEFKIKRSTGKVEFNQCDADTIYVKTNTGSVTGSLLSEKVFITDTDTGKVDVPKTITGGRCEITTDTGSIIISVE